MKKLIVLSILYVGLISTSLTASSPFLLKFYYPSGRDFYVEPIKTEPVRYGNKFAFIVDSYLFIVNILNGKTSKVILPEPSSFSPLISSKDLYIVGDRGGIYSFSLTTSTVSKIGEIPDLPLSKPFTCGKRNFIFIQGRGGIYKILNGKIERIPFEEKTRLYWGNSLPSCHNNLIYAFSGMDLFKVEPERFFVVQKVFVSSGYTEITGKKYYGSPFPVIVREGRVVIATPGQTFFLKNDIVEKVKDIRITGVSFIDNYVFLSGNDGIVVKLTANGSEVMKLKLSDTDEGLAPVVKIGNGFFATGDDEFLILFDNSGTVIKYYTTSGISGKILLIEPFKFSFLSRAGNFYVIYLKNSF